MMNIEKNINDNNFVATSQIAIKFEKKKLKF